MHHEPRKAKYHVSSCFFEKAGVNKKHAPFPASTTSTAGSYPIKATTQCHS